ncbi:MAG: sel1 repeat family protein [Bacteroidales bacterium]|nr:sel1 repeat family protein [Bacteroidales bacterium]
MKKAFWAILIAIATISCKSANSSSTDDEQTATAIDTTMMEKYSDNNTPIFDDNDGAMAQLYEKEGYAYSKELEQDAYNGNIEAQQLLASMYAYGIGGVAPDRKKAYIIYRGLAEHGDADAQAIVGYMLLYGLGPVEDTEMGLEWLAKSANQQSAFAFYILGNFYNYNLESTEATRTQARLYYMSAAKLGQQEAQAELDKMAEK